MTAEEIRAKWAETKQSVINDQEWTAWAMIELVAQIAELNQNIKTATKERDRGLRSNAC
jgi:hypothetical protein